MSSADGCVDQDLKASSRGLAARIKPDLESNIGNIEKEYLMRAANPLEEAFRRSEERRVGKECSS